MTSAEIFDDRPCVLGEGPSFDDRTGRVSWVDVGAERLLWRDLATGEAGETPFDELVSAAVPRAGGGVVLCMSAGVVLADADGTLHPLIPFHDTVQIDLRANDAKADPAGRLWVGTMNKKERSATGALYRLDPADGRLVRILDGVTVSNGLGWSVDAATMYYIDTPTRRIDAFDYDLATGEISGRRPFAEFPEDAGMPDGMCIDGGGFVWVAAWGGGMVRRYAPDGTLERTVTLPTSRVTSCTFAGPDLDLLVITTASVGDSAGQPGAGLTYSYRPGDAVGRAVDRFAG
ncbi:sugar lactone lactonase YvrE [Allocatelliglobosispora scoriae]|uniref:Sugar lactone lactonase YvrE n=1 Tax=Allocatelliglobosispora scoriae TaxID=643052 RepID=A0A841BN92_9ACTN|nr:SMP-30/gluconolactonase/LRE family protein [Allocatelliglobosispora scoriae]MBB5868659.1 sugar lactone lactonase YvrE [Allocatelliglobosispora scoriae]